MNGNHAYGRCRPEHTLQRFAALVLLLTSIGAASALAHGGDDHGGAEPAPAASATAAELSTHGQTERFELLLKYAATEVNEPMRLRFFLADFPTNRPVADANFVVSSRPGGMKTQGPATMVSPGIYEMTATFPADTAYTLVTTFALPDGQEQIELQNVYTGESAEHFLEEHGVHAPGEHADEGASGGWMLPASIAGAALLLFAAAMMVRRRRQPTEATAGIPVAADAGRITTRETEEKR